jgi:formylglycine-generating enzyme required for sulfatase activity
VTVGNTTPTLGNVSISSSAGNYNTSVYTCSTSVTDIDQNSSTVYSWSVGGIVLATGTSLDAATEALLPSDALVCTVTVTDGDSGGTVSNSSSVTLLNRTPTTPSVSVTWSGNGTTPVTGDSLTCVASGSTDADGQSVSYTYSWSTTASNGPSSGATVGGSYVLDGDTWTCTAVATDGTATSGSDSDSVTIDVNCGLTGCDSNLDLGGTFSMDMVLIPGGTFTMGAPSSEVGYWGDEIQHSVTLTNDFYVMTTEVTQGMFYQLMNYDPNDGQVLSDYTGVYGGNGSYGVGNDYPVFYVSWNMAAEFANAATQRHNAVYGTSLQECYSCTGTGTSVTCTSPVNPYQCTGYRFLTEAEWEYVARAGTSAALWTSNGGGNIPSGYNDETYALSDGFDLRLYAQYQGNNGGGYAFGAKEVGQLLPNDFGVYDMHGNVWEWAHDWYGAVSTSAVTNPNQSTAHSWGRIMRGGDWHNGPNFIRSAQRYAMTQTYRTAGLGFRLALNP